MNFPKQMNRDGTMSRQERRAAAAHERRWKDKTAEVGMVIKTQGFIADDGMHYWFEPPNNWTQDDGLPDGADIYGPFTTATEVEENQRRVLLGPECEVTHGGMWDPAWDRLQ
jgi:hypothetical protein